MAGSAFPNEDDLPPPIAEAYRQHLLISAEAVLATDNEARWRTHGAAPLCSWEERDFVLAIEAALDAGRLIEPDEVERLKALCVRGANSAYATLGPGAVKRMQESLRIVKAGCVRPLD